MDPDSPVNGELLPKDYRAGAVGAVCSAAGEVLVFQRTGRIGPSSWQFPQGGIEPGETPRACVLRELNEETGLEPSDVDIIDWHPQWLSYKLPEKMRPDPRRGKPFIGQQQAWFLLALRSGSTIELSLARDKEFAAWQWIEPHVQAGQVIHFKHAAYKAALEHFAAGAMRDEPGWEQLRAS